MARKLKRLPLPSRQPSLLQRWFRNSETILLARITALTGFVIAVLGALDWSSLVNLDVTNKKQTVFTGLIVLAQGVAVEAARRRPGSSDPV